MLYQGSIYYPVGKLVYMQMKSRSFRRISAYHNALLPGWQAILA
jgi:hypothetical protein